jgi:hypothetical protein
MKNGTFTVKISTGNDAMRTPQNVAAALVRIAAHLHNDRVDGKILDANGNSVGEFYYIPDSQTAPEYRHPGERKGTR